MSSLLKLSLLCIALMMSLCSCSIFSPVKNENATVYVLNKKTCNLPKRRNSGHNILVTQPQINSVYNTTQIAYTTRPYQIDYFIKSRWADSPAEMLLPMITDALNKTHYYHAVGSSGSLVHSDYLLNTRIVELLVDFTDRPASLHLIVHADLIRSSDASLISSREFNLVQPLNQYTPYGGVVAANRAASRLVSQLTRYCLNHT